MIVGKVIGGSVGGKLIIRLKSDAKVDVGDILVIKDNNDKYFVKIVNMGISSLIPNQFIEDIAGQNLEYDLNYNIFDEKDRFYRICEAKTLKILRNNSFIPPRSIPNHFSNVYKINSDEFKFINTKGEIEIGYLRLGTDFLKDVVISLPAKKLISHHVLVSAATGKGKSNFAKVFIRGIMNYREYSSIVFDPHDEYYGGKGHLGLKDLPNKDKLLFFTPRWEENPGSERLIIYSCDLEPSDFHGIIDLTQAQQEALEMLYRKYGDDWINILLREKTTGEIIADLKGKVQRVTLISLRRKLFYSLEIEEDGTGLTFSLEPRRETSIFDKIKNAVLEKKTIIIDTSLVGDEAEKLIASSIVRKLFFLYRKTKQVNPNKFNYLPELLILFEEAPRVLGKEVLARGTNIFEKIAREGRKFKIGLCAITQMPSLLPREILSQMNTKVILGIPAPSDRIAIVESSSQNIEDESSEIQILDKGEAIITSPFVDFPLPVKIFKFENLVKQSKRSNEQINIGF